MQWNHPPTVPCTIRTMNNVNTEALRPRFSELAEIWNNDTRFSSSSTEIIEHWAYQEVISMGVAVVPLLLEAVATNWHWVAALAAVTGENPGKGLGYPHLIKPAWVRWGEQRHGQTSETL